MYRSPLQHHCCDAQHKNTHSIQVGLTAQNELLKPPKVTLNGCEQFLWSQKVTFTLYDWTTGWRSWFRHCGTSRQVAGSIPNGVIGIFY